MSTKKDALEAFLDAVVEKTTVSSREYDLIMDLLHNEGFKALLGLLLATRQGFLIQLAHTPLHDELHRSSASVIQGQIRGIDAIRETLLSLVPEDADPTEQEQIK